MQNNPIKLTDPTGHRCVGDDEGCIDGGGGIGPTPPIPPADPPSGGGGGTCKSCHTGSEPSTSEDSFSDWYAGTYSGCFMCHAGQAYGQTSLTNTQLAAYNETLSDYGGYYGMAMLGGAAVGTGIGLAAHAIVGGAGACAANSQCSTSAQSTASSVWTFSSNGPITQNGITYSQHALYRMSPVGLGGRGIPPSVVQNVIANGQQVPSRYDPTAMKISLDNVTILLNNITNTVITVRKGR